MPPRFPLLPQRLSGLADIAGNLSWSWNRDARAIFRTIDPLIWTRCRHDPIRILNEVSGERLAQCAADPDFLAQYDALMRWHASEQSDDVTWFAQTYPDQRRRAIAYFCAEFGFYHSVPIYSGGLGVLAGDHCKTASDLGVPIVGVGILYRHGYFDQRIRSDGWQEDADDPFDIHNTVLEPVEAPHATPYLTAVRTSGRDVFIRAWRLRAGRVSVYLLDTDFDQNHPDDRPLLSKLYAGGPELRLKQEWLLGVGGVRVLRSLGIKPAVWHANEGHAAFMHMERLREFHQAGVPLDESIRRVRATSVFTTHTPVPAGHDMFRMDQVLECTGPIPDALGIDRDTFMMLGHHPLIDHDTFHMTAAAIRLSHRVNAVSRPHAAVTRHLWASLWPDRREDEVPVGYVTNGVHLATWMANSVMALLERHLGPDWGARVDDPQLWEQVLTLDDEALWRVHRRLKETLLMHVREHARHAFARRAQVADQLVGSGVLLDPHALTIGFARRFATYKRAHLIFEDTERLLRIVTNPARPVQIVFAGKAHPADNLGKQVLQEVYQATRDPRFEGRVAFVEDYDLHLAHVLVQGVDLWMNLPRVPMEASGTSGMKAALNGVPQLGTVDGWWEEGFNGHNGWSVVEDPAAPDAEVGPQAAAQVYHLLERHVVPAFYDRDSKGVPHAWIEVMKHAIRAAGMHFTGQRMLTEYVRDYYVPAIVGDAGADVPPTG
ncbi:MAG TPA: alpha-glucan family phosphorylase [Gemmatimonadaceae bacterium]|nr:alpha-glucan family phosphorylase [Gemmatimonadaceae bacterium]